MIVASLPDLEQLGLEAAKALLIAQHQTYTAALSSRAGEIEQLELELEDLEVASAAEEQATSTRASRPVAAKPSRCPLPEHLPREIHTHSQKLIRALTAEAGSES